MTTDADVDLRCSPWTRDQGIDPVGSAVPIDVLVAVELPLPWPADIGDADWIAPIDTPDGTRFQAIVPETPRIDGSVLVTRWTRTGAHFAGIEWLVPASDIPATLRAVVAGDDPPGATEAPPEILICGHGTRDRCCGGSGTRLTIAVRAALPDVRIRRTSHLGGHRYAPTALTLPDGRAWAYLDSDTVVGIVRRSIDPVVARQHYRGAAALDPWAQVVEADVLETEGWSALDADTLEADISIDGDLTAVTLRWDGPDGPRERHAEVGVRREYPVLVCGEPPDHATKTAMEYELR